MRKLALPILLCLSLGIAFLSTSPPQEVQAQVTKPPNVLVILTDDQRADADSLSVMDDTLRIFRDGGTYFPNAVATTPLCCPSRASIFSGKYVHNHGVTSQKNATNLPQEWTLQYHLQQNLGYTTALVGKYLNNWSGPKPYFDYVKGGIFTNYYSNGKYTTRVIRRHALSLLNTFETSDAKPWLMYVQPFAPHAPAVPETAYANAFVPLREKTPAWGETDLSDKPTFVKNKASKTSKSSVRALRRKMIRTLYSVDDMNKAIFKRLAALREDNTIAFFMSDNGFMWYEHRLQHKMVAYDDSVRIPMFVRWPGRIRAGVTDPDIVANIDVAATVYDALGYTPANYEPDGRSMFSSSRPYILTEFRASNPWYALWHPDWMYARYDNGFREYYGPDDPWQLDNAFKTGKPIPDAAALANWLNSAMTCAGAACP
jgi:arylsulfatase A-like enzyme